MGNTSSLNGTRIWRPDFLIGGESRKCGQCGLQSVWQMRATICRKEETIFPDEERGLIWIATTRPETNAWG